MSSLYSCLRPAPRLAPLALALALSACAGLSAPPPLTIELVALNDFHGNLEASKFSPLDAGGVSVADAATRAQRRVLAGGIDTLGAALHAWRRDDPELLLVGAGDLVGASPAISSYWADEPTIDALNLLGLQASATGNHEFDQGRRELLRQQRGGCQSNRPQKACKFAPAFDGARFSYLAANVIDAASGQPLLPPYRILQAHGVKLAFIGAVLRDTPALVLPSGIAGLRFDDEAASINRLLPELKAQGAEVFVVLIHEGGATPDAYDAPGCAALKGPIVDIVKRLDPAIRLVISGHTHHGYLCEVDGRTVTQAEMGGHLLTRIALRLDARSHALQGIEARNVLMQPGAWPADAASVDLLARVRARSAQSLARPLARLAVPRVARKVDAAGEAPLGDLVADSVLAATRAEGAQIGLVNTGALRQDLETGEGQRVSFGQAQIVMPFSNTLVLMTMTGAKLRQLLEQQWLTARDDEHGMLQVSAGFHYRWDARRAPGQRVLPGSMTLDGVPIGEAQTLRVAANSFLAEGGDNYSMFQQAGDKRDTQIVDLDALVDYLTQRAQAGQPAGGTLAAGRIELVK